MKLLHINYTYHNIFYTIKSLIIVISHTLHIDSIVLLYSQMGASQSSESITIQSPASPAQPAPGNISPIVTLGAGCYWGTEKYIRKDFQKKFPDSVKSATVGFMNPDPDHKPNPSYREVCTGATGHVEVLHVELYDPNQHYEEVRWSPPHYQRSQQRSTILTFLLVASLLPTAGPSLLHVPRPYHQEQAGQRCRQPVLLPYFHPRRRPGNNSQEGDLARTGEIGGGAKSDISVPPAALTNNPSPIASILALLPPLGLRFPRHPLQLRGHRR